MACSGVSGGGEWVHRCMGEMEVEVFARNTSERLIEVDSLWIRSCDGGDGLEMSPGCQGDGPEQSMEQNLVAAGKRNCSAGGAEGRLSSG